MKWFHPFIAFLFIGVLSCGSEPVAQPAEPVPVAQPVSPAPVIAAPAPESPPAETHFDFTNITEEVRTHTRADVQQFIGNLNEIIVSKNYRAWVDNLGESYLAKISSQEYLDNVSQQPRLKSQKIVLNSAEDYFINVVVPSRASTNDRVDDVDIEFVPNEEKVLAFRVASNGQRLRLYELENVGGAWKIVN
jgi:hypothetical protein